MTVPNQRETEYHPRFLLCYLLTLHFVGCHSKPFASTGAFLLSRAIFTGQSKVVQVGSAEHNTWPNDCGANKASHNGPSGAFFRWCCFCKAWMPCSCHYFYRCNCNSEKEKDDHSLQMLYVEGTPPSL